MNLYIEIKNGQPVNHPAFEENLLQAFSQVPSCWEKFVRVEQPSIGIYETFESNSATYEKVSGIWTDVWRVRDMTIEEKVAKQQEVISLFNSREQAENWSAWTLDEITCKMIPPIERPELNQEKVNAGIMTFWCGAENSWKDTPIRPSDDGQYKFDFLSWNWVLV
jgi:hypothetical protein